MSRLNFKTVLSGFSLRRATCELGDFRVWYAEETWWWSLNDTENSYGSEETLDDAIAACQKHYDNLLAQANKPKKVFFDDFYMWRQAWYADHPCGERLGQAFCNHFYEKIGRGDHTMALFYSADNLYSESLICQNFIDWDGTQS